VADAHSLKTHGSASAFESALSNPQQLQHQDLYHRNELVIGSIFTVKIDIYIENFDSCQHPVF